MKLQQSNTMSNFPNFKLVFIIILSHILVISCEKKTSVNRETSSDINDAEWQKGRKLFLETCGICHQAVKKDEIFKRYITSIAALNAEQKQRI